MQGERKEGVRFRGSVMEPGKLMLVPAKRNFPSKDELRLILSYNADMFNGVDERKLWIPPSGCLSSFF